jgi:flagellin FlaB
MGFSSTQQAKETVTKGMAEASSALHVSGEVVSATDIPRSKVNATQFPIKIVAGGTGVNLNATLATVKFNTGLVQYDNILSKPCVLTSTSYSSMALAMTAANTAACLGGAAANNPIGTVATGPAVTKAVIYWTVQKNTNEILDPGEHANLVLVYSNSDRPGVSQPINAELILDSGAPVDFSRTVPPLTDKYTNMG